MSHRRTAAAVALSTVALALAGCADQASTANDDSAEDAATSTASSSAADVNEAVVAHAKAYAALVDHPAFVQVQTAEPEMLPAFVDDVTRHRLTASSNGNMWTFTDVSGPCATKLSTDDTGGELHGTTCGGVAVDEEFAKALQQALAS